jgi:asparaginyl-tRNA synthetase
MLQHSKYRLPVRGSSLYQLIKHVYQNKNQSKDTISTRGWIQTIRSSKHCSFIELNDGSFPKNLQIVVDNDKLTPTNSSGLLTGASIEITGKLNFFRNKSTGEELPEIHCDQITLIGSSDGSYPVQKKFHTKGKKKTTKTGKIQWK